jgi:hypothetical protein
MKLLFLPRTSPSKWAGRNHQQAHLQELEEEVTRSKRSLA